MKKWIGLVALLFTLPMASLNKDGLLGINRTFSAQTSGHSKFGMGFLADVTLDQGMFGTMAPDGRYPVQFIDSMSVPQNCPAGNVCYDVAGSSLEGMYGANAYFFMSLGLGPIFDFSLALPLYYETYSQVARWSYLRNTTTNTIVEGSEGREISGITKTGNGDLRISAKLRAPIPEEDYIIDLALIVGGSISMSSEKGLWVRETEYLGTETSDKTTGFGMPQNSWKAGLATTLDFRRMDDGVPLLLHANLAYRAPMADYPEIMWFSGAAEIYLMEYFSIFGELYKEMPKKAPATEIDVMEITAGGAIHTEIGIELYVAAHSFIGDAGKYAILEGGETTNRLIKYQARTIPNLYGMVGLTWHGYLIPQDRDKDGVLDKNDKCPDEPEDEDGFDDDDGCPDIDNDKDGIPDVDDQCPLKPEDMDGFEDEDGCPDPDNDGDGVKDALDRCPLVPQGESGKDGCPSLDTDGDGISDDRDLCPSDPEDKDGFMDQDGCPDPDNDMDGFCDPWVSENNLLATYSSSCKGTDKCPNAQQGPGGKDGCPLNDADFDGVADDVDECPTLPEDRDGFEDTDGCPDPDNDKDGVADSLDLCPLVPQGPTGKNGCPMVDRDADGIPDDIDECPTKPEDFDGFEDSDGCPDYDNDRDGVADSLDKCPLVPAGPNGIAGCPRVDTDGDGIFDDKDLCPTEPEDKDGFEDADGCPDIDNDKDGIVDSLDKCPNQPETMNGFKDEDGCPDEKVKPIEDNVTLDGVNFKTGTAELTFESRKVLDAIVEQLQAYPEVHIEIRGHTDNIGKKKNNQVLSEKRAKAIVDYFASKGVLMTRMTFAGFADDQPIDDNKTAKGRAKNRRIEMYRTK